MYIFHSDLGFGREALPINNLNPHVRTGVDLNTCLLVRQMYDIGCSFLIHVETEENKIICTVSYGIRYKV